MVATVHAIARRQNADGATLDGPGLKRLISAAMPLFRQLDTDQKRKAMQLAIPHSEIEFLEEGTHGAVIEFPERVNDAVTSFLHRHLGQRRKVRGDQLGDLTGWSARGLREHHRGVGRVVAVLGLAGHLPGAVHGIGQARRRERPSHTLRQPIRQFQRAIL